MPTDNDNPASTPLKGALSALGFGPEDDQITEKDLTAFVPTKPAPRHGRRVHQGPISRPGNWNFDWHQPRTRE